MDVKYYQEQNYPNPPCWNMVADVYTRELGQGVQDFRTVTDSIRDIANAFRFALQKSNNGFMQIPEPVNMCIVLMGKSHKLGIHHCGIFLDGHVLHALPEGVVYQDMASLKDIYPLIEFWSKA
ncbi:hypothetical protein W822_19975 [Advenella kashmirensis W13003]|uniref:NlpC/P60 domain-containing protein n=1 Tax=Advenella kashmirensis W13003 TaxID=1424334 RepID=V8QMN9_9BURK|nr:hypothetical protein [Advenella kashmirensis]ETF00932.1 hypothetical protein W822_19975 [Advenella kashmirensis W13003]